MMKLIDLTFLILQLSSLIDSDNHRGVTIDEVEDHIASGDLFIWMRGRFPSLDLSLYSEGRGLQAAHEITQELQSLFGGYAGDERRKWGIENSGICLLLSWTNELIQQRAFSD